MAKFGSRGKGKRGEREVAKLLQHWWDPFEPGCEFASTPLSGGWNKASIRSGMKLSGDLCTTAKHFPFVVEVKWREKWTLENVIAGKRSPIWGWWEQAKTAAAEQGGTPILVFKKNRDAWYFLARAGDLPDLIFASDDDHHVERNGEVLLVGFFAHVLHMDPGEFACAP